MILEALLKATEPEQSFLFFFSFNWSIPVGSVLKSLTANAGDTSLIPGSGRSPGEGNGNPLQYSCLGNCKDKGAWLARIWSQKRAGHNLAAKTTIKWITQFSWVAQSCPTLCNPMDCSSQAFLSITNSWSSLKLMSIESVMPSNHLMLGCPLLLPPSVFPSIRVFPNESVLCIRRPKYWSHRGQVSLNGHMEALVKK